MNTNTENNTNSNNTLYLVTSAAGFMGGIAVRKLLKRGDNVRAFVLKGDPAIKYVPEEAEIFEGDLCDKESVKRFFEVPEGTETICLHIASLVTVNPEYNQKVMDVNVGGVRNIIDCCAEHPECKKLVYVSSTGAIPELPKGQRISEIEHNALPVINYLQPLLRLVRSSDFPTSDPLGPKLNLFVFLAAS